MSASFTIDLATAGIDQLEQAQRAGEVTSVTLTDGYLARIDTLSVHGPHLNAVRCLDPTARAQAAARDAERASGAVCGPLHGIPVLVKDNIDVAHLPTSAGSVALAHSVPAADAPLVAALRRAGVVILGKANLTELANYTTEGMPSGYSSLGGQVLNPYDASCTPSGSSSGSAVAAAAGLAAAAVGTETSGSILSPAQACSVVGVKPTVGLVSRTGVVPISSTQDTPGPMTRSVRDAAWLLAAMMGGGSSGDDADRLPGGGDPEDPATANCPLTAAHLTAELSGDALPGARLGVMADTSEIFAAALEVLRRRGATLVEVALPEVTAESVLSYEFARDFRTYCARLPAGCPVRTLADVVAYNDAHARDALKFGQTLLLESARVDLDDPDTLARYTTARELGLDQARAAIDSALTVNRLDAVVSASAATRVGARAGYPSVSVPAGYTTHGREPVSVVFLGTAWSEPRLLALAHDYEQASPMWRSPAEVNPSLFRSSMDG